MNGKHIELFLIDGEPGGLPQLKLLDGRATCLQDHALNWRNC